METKIEDVVLDSVYLNKRNSNHDSDWVYYRITSLGEKGDPITVCQVRWPTFGDIDLIWDQSKAVITTPGLTESGSAHEKLCRLMKNSWDINHEDSTFIGFLEH